MSPIAARLDDGERIAVATYNASLGDRRPGRLRQAVSGWSLYLEGDPERGLAPCARCHGQDALPNPVAANLLTSMAPGGPTADQKAFTTVVMEGRTDRGMPAFKGSLEPAQVEAIYQYLRGRAEKRIPAGRPKRPGG